MALTKSRHFLSDVAAMVRGERPAGKGGKEIREFEEIKGEQRSAYTVYAYPPATPQAKGLDGCRTTTTYRICPVLDIWEERIVADCTKDDGLWGLRIRCPANDPNVLKNHEKRIKARTTREREDKVFLNFLIALVLICLVAGLIDWARTQARFPAHSPLLVRELPTIV